MVAAAYPALHEAHPAALHGGVLVDYVRESEELRQLRVKLERDFIIGKIKTLFKDSEKMNAYSERFGLEVQEIERRLIAQVQALLDTNEPLKDEKGFYMIVLQRDDGSMEQVNSHGRKKQPADPNA